MIDFFLECSIDDYLHAKLVPYSYQYGTRQYTAMYFSEYGDYTLGLFDGTKSESYYYVRNKGWITTVPSLNEDDPFLTWDELINIVTLDIL